MRSKAVKQIKQVAEVFSKKGITLDTFESLDLLNRLAEKDSSMKKLRDSYEVGSEVIIHGSKALKVYSQVERELSKEIASSNLGRIGSTVAAKHYQLSLAARLASQLALKRESKPKQLN